MATDKLLEPTDPVEPGADRWDVRNRHSERPTDRDFPGLPREKGLSKAQERRLRRSVRHQNGAAEGPAISGPDIITQIGPDSANESGVNGQISGVETASQTDPVVATEIQPEIVLNSQEISPEEEARRKAISKHLETGEKIEDIDLRHEFQRYLSSFQVVVKENKQKIVRPARTASELASVFRPMSYMEQDGEVKRKGVLMGTDIPVETNATIKKDEPLDRVVDAGEEKQLFNNYIVGDFERWKKEQRNFHLEVKRDRLEKASEPNRVVVEKLLANWGRVKEVGIKFDNQRVGQFDEEGSFPEAPRTMAVVYEDKDNKMQELVFPAALLQAYFTNCEPLRLDEAKAVYEKRDLDSLPVVGMKFVYDGGRYMFIRSDSSDENIEAVLKRIEINWQKLPDDAKITVIRRPSDLKTKDHDKLVD